MRHEELKLKATDGTELFAQCWAAAEPHALVCLVHGFGEHSGRYTHVAEAMVAAGLAVVAIDQRGFGRSPGKRGYTPTYLQNLKDIGTLIETAKGHFPNLPTFLYGHSMGGGMVLNYTLRFKPQLAGVISTSPWLRLVTAPPSWLISLARFIGLFWPQFTIEREGEGGVLSRDPAIEEAMDADPLSHGAMSVPLFLGANDGGAWVLSQAKNFPLPLLLMHGDADKLTAYDASAAFAQNAPTQTTTFERWPGYYHETHNDIGKEEVIETIIEWINERA